MPRLKPFYNAQFLRRDLKKFWPEMVLIGLAVFFIFFYSFLALYTYQHYGTGFDLAFFSNVLWNFSHHLSPNTLLGYYFTGVTNFLGLHFSPIVLGLSPLFLLPNPTAFLLFFQTLILVAALIPIYLLARHFNLPKPLIVLVALFYLVAPDFQSLVLLNFHELALYPLLFFSALYGFFTERKILYWVFIGLIIITKENLPLIVAALGLFFIIHRQYRTGLITFLVGASSFFTITQVIIPLINGQTYVYSHYFSQFGSNFTDIVRNAFFHPLNFALQLFTPLQKLATPFFQAAVQPVSFLLVPSALVLLIPSVLEKLLSNVPYHWAIFGFQYNIVFLTSQIFILLWVGRLLYENSPAKNQRSFLLRSIKKNKLLRRGVLGYPLFFTAVFIIGFKFVFPFASPASLQALHFLPIYSSAVSRGLAELVARTPPQTAVAVSDYNTVAHLSNRRSLSLFPYVGQADYLLLIDLNQDLFPELFRHIRTSAAYQLVFNNEQGALYRRLEKDSPREQLRLRELCEKNQAYSRLLFPSASCDLPTLYKK